MLKIHTFHVSGTHCAACKLLIEDVLKEQDMVKNVGVDLKRETVEIETNSDQNPEELARILTEKIKPNGYALSVEKIPRVPLGKFEGRRQFLCLLRFFFRPIHRNFRKQKGRRTFG